MPLGVVEPTLKYHPGVFEVLTLARDPGWGNQVLSERKIKIETARKIRKQQNLEDRLKNMH